MTLAHGDHVCSVCESTCDSVAALKMRVRDLERELLRMSFMLATFERALNVPVGSSEHWFPVEAS